MQRATNAVLVVFCFLTFWVHVAGAQEFTRTEIGIDTSILHPSRPFSSVTDAGLGGRVTYNFSANFGIDSEFDPYFTNLEQKDLQSGGRAIAGLVGPKAGIRTRKYGVFFKARPGFISFSDVATSASTQNILATARKTHAALDLGAVAELYPSARLILRFDVGQLLVRYGDATLLSVPGVFSIRTNGTIGGPLHIGVGASYRLGRLRTASENSPAPSPLQFGVQYSLQTLQRDILTVRDESSVGGWLTYALSRHFALDAAAGFFPREDRFVSFQQGGQMIQAVAGVRWGVRRDRWGVFAKFRPGVQIYTLSSGFDFRNLFSPHQALPSYTSYAFDSGGIFEVYASKHTMFRFDAGDTEIHFRKRHFLDGTGSPFTAPARTRPSIQLTAGFGFRL